jgi:very-short-patch-repair endonuclease
MSDKQINLLERAKTLRSNQTDAEKHLWYYLRAHRFMKMKFKRQMPIGRYIVDFVCEEHKLIIEIDGGQHQDAVDYDERRTKWLQQQGYEVLRFWNNEVLQQTESMLEVIRAEVLKRIFSFGRDL